jgi:hypothetical protein
VAGLLLVFAGLFPVSNLPTSAHANPPETCGVWRWGIKTLSDGNASEVNFEPRARTIRSLRALAPPAALGRNTPRVGPTEYQVYRLRARLLEHKWVCCGGGDDGDYHLVLADPKNRARTMIAEMSDPGCPGARNSSRVAALRAVRRKYDALFGPPPKGRFGVLGNRPLVFVTGVGFFDAVHGQKGVAPNGIELHPVLDVAPVP